MHSRGLGIEIQNDVMADDMTGAESSPPLEMQVSGETSEGQKETEQRMSWVPLILQLGLPLQPDNLCQAVCRWEISQTSKMQRKPICSHLSLFSVFGHSLEVAPLS